MAQAFAFFRTPGSAPRISWVIRVWIQNPSTLGYLTGDSGSWGLASLRHRSAPSKERRPRPTFATFQCASTCSNVH
jgi:hypothetical protein